MSFKLHSDIKKKCYIESILILYLDTLNIYQTYTGCPEFEILAAQKFSFLGIF